MAAKTTQEIKISVIVPIYNVEKYLADCLDSVIGQSLKEIEIICVNDCSLDSSYDILLQYANLDQRITIINNTENKGLSYARNAGLSQARGKYVWFVDSDDMILPDSLERLYYYAETTQSEGILFDTEMIFETEELSKESRYKPFRAGDYNEVTSGAMLFAELVAKGDYDPCVWRQFWRKDYLKENRLDFYEGLLHEDRLFTFQAILSCAAILCVKEAFYVYRKRKEAITTKEISDQNIKCIILGIEEMVHFWRLHDFTDEVDQAITAYIQMSVRYVVALTRNMKKKAKDTYIKSGFDKITDAFFDLLWLEIKEEGTAAVNYKENQAYLFPFGKVEKNSEIVLYAAGKVGRSYYSQLVQTRFARVVGWIDKRVTLAEGKEIMKPEQIQKLNYDYIIIAIENELIANEIKDEIIRLYNVEEDKIIWSY